jgi:predicted GNAT family acetyltransferase
MLETREYFGIRDDDRLVSVAGIHVYSRRYRVAALGNIVTRHECRGKGYGTQVTTALCKSLWEKEIRIGLNVRADNTPAITCYSNIGFRITAPYEEYLLVRRTDG